jgi:hypothetical protein
MPDPLGAALCNPIKDTEHQGSSAANPKSAFFRLAR